MSLVVPAVLPYTREELLQELAIFDRIPSVSRIQIDVVDGRFAAPACWPYNAPGELKTWVNEHRMLPQLEHRVYEIDLMCLDAEEAALEWLVLGATRLTFHAESVTNVGRMLSSVRARYGHFVAMGIALNIESDVSLIENNLSDVEYVQFMGIARIGQQGQVFDRRVLDKIRTFKAKHPDMPVQVDGGVTLQNGKELLALQVTSLVVGSAIVRARDPYKAVAEFDALESSYGV